MKITDKFSTSAPQQSVGAHDVHAALLEDGAVLGAHFLSEGERVAFQNAENENELPRKFRGNNLGFRVEKNGDTISALVF